MAQQICIDYIKLGTGGDALGDQSLPVGFSPGVYSPTPGDLLENHLEGIDDLFDDVINTGILVKTGAVVPTGAVTPDWVGQIYHDTAADTFWLANGVTNTDWVQIAVGPGAGETNTASNQGVAGVGVVLAKVGADLRFKSISSGDGLTVVDDVANDAIRIDFSAEVGDLDDVSLVGLLDGYFLKWNNAAGEWQPAAGTGELTTASNQGLSGVGVFDGKVGTDLQFRNISSPDGSVAVTLDAPDKEIQIQVNPDQISLNDLGDVEADPVLDGDMFAFDGANWVNTREIGAGHDRNDIATAAALGGANARIYPGDADSPYAGLRGVSVGGDGAEVYGDDSVALNQSKTYGEFGLGAGEASAIGSHAAAFGNAPTEAGGDGSVAAGQAAQAGGHNSLAIGDNTVRTGIGVKAVTLANSGADLVVTIPGEDLSALFTASVPFKLFGLSGGTHDPTAHPNVLDLVVASSAFTGGNTEITVSGVNSTASAARLVRGSSGDHALAMGDAALAQGVHSFAFGLGAQALHDHAMARGRNVKSRNKFEQVLAAGQIDDTNQAQARDLILQGVAVPASVTINLAVDHFGGGTEEIETADGHAYAFHALILGHGRVDPTTQVAAGWEATGLAVQENGALRIVGVPTVTDLGNDDAAIFDTDPVIGADGSNLRITVADDGQGNLDLYWLARVSLAEIGAV